MKRTVSGLSGNSGQSMRKKLGLINRVQRALRRFNDDDDEAPDSTSVGRSMARFYFEQLRIEQDRIQRYKDYDEMDKYSGAIIGSALDVYADNATCGSLDHRTPEQYRIVTDNVRALSVIDLTERVTKIKETIWPIARALAKYGDEIGRAHV